MEFPQLIEARRSVRKYSADPVDPAALERILRMVSRAPSAGNLQAYRICVVRSARKRKALSDSAGGQEFLSQAPVDLVFFADSVRSSAKYGDRGASLYAVQDATIAATFAALAATHEGLASAWVGAFDESTVQNICDERELRPIAIVPIGHAAERPDPTSRRELEEMVKEA
jgi:nitroreductase